METTVIDWRRNCYRSSTRKSLRLFRFCVVPRKDPSNIQIPTKLGRKGLKGSWPRKATKEISWNDWWSGQCWFYFLKRAFFSIRKLCCMFEDNEAVIKMIIKGRSPTMRHVSRTHRVALDWLFDRINLDSKNPHQVHRHQKPTCWHFDQRNFHMWWVGIIFCVCLTSAIFQFYRVSWSDVEKNARRLRWRKSHSKFEDDDEFGLATQRKGS